MQSLAGNKGWNKNKYVEINCPLSLVNCIDLEKYYFHVQHVLCLASLPVQPGKQNPPKNNKDLVIISNIWL